MRVLIIGGSGIAGRATASELVGRGHQVAVLSRRGTGGPAGAEAFAGDLTTGDGLPAALAGADAVVDCANVLSTCRATAIGFFTSTTARLGALASAAGVGHHVVLSIVGVDVVPLGYYEGKLAQERTVLAGPVPATVLRATQFHDFVGQITDRLRIGPLRFAPKLVMQPVAVTEVASALADTVEAGPAGRMPDLAGPRREYLPDLARKLGRSVVTVPLPGAYGKAVRAGGLLPGPDAVLRGPTFDAWLAGADNHQREAD